MAQRGCSQVVECGPGKVLAPLVRRIEGTLEGVPLNTAASIMDATL